MKHITEENPRRITTYKLNSNEMALGGMPDTNGIWISYDERRPNKTGVYMVETAYGDVYPRTWVASWDGWYDIGVIGVRRWRKLSIIDHGRADVWKLLNNLPTWEEPVIKSKDVQRIDAQERRTKFWRMLYRIGLFLTVAATAGSILGLCSQAKADSTPPYELPSVDMDCYLLDDGMHKGWRMVDYTEQLKVQVQVRTGVLEWRRDPSLICKSFTTKKEEVRWVEWVRPSGKKKAVTTKPLIKE